MPTEKALCEPGGQGDRAAGGPHPPCSPRHPPPLCASATLAVGLPTRSPHHWAHGWPLFILWPSPVASTGSCLISSLQNTSHSYVFCHQAPGSQTASIRSELCTCSLSAAHLCLNNECQADPRGQLIERRDPEGPRRHHLGNPRQLHGGGGIRALGILWL